jgi:eukaryotic-like serine/threonine-protein kinase
MLAAISVESSDPAMPHHRGEVRTVTADGNGTSFRTPLRREHLDLESGWIEPTPGRTMHEMLTGPPHESGTDIEVVRTEVVRRLFGEETETSPRIGRFSVLRRIGQGGMGRVYAAYDERLDRRVAVKVLHRDVDESSRHRVLREAKAMAKLSHPNVVQVYEVGEHEGKLFIAMEFVEGATLNEWQSATGRTRQEILAAYMEAGEGLAAAHAAGLIHRDFKPQNVMVEPRDRGAPRVRVLDFGLARLLEAGPSPESMTSSSDRTDPDGDPRLTVTGRLVGTPAYMAPEQFSSGAVNAAADQFSFCVALWEGLHGERPYPGTTITELVTSISSGRLRDPPRQVSVPGWLRAAIIRGLAVDARDRYPSMAALLEALARDPAKRRGRWLSMAAGLTALGLGAAGLRSWAEGHANRCSGAAEQLAEVWDETRRDAVRSAILGTGLAYAPAAWEQIGSQVDAWANDWVRTHYDTCEATRRGEQSAVAMDLRMTCLNRARVGLAATIGVLADATPAVVERVYELVDGLPSLARCSDLETLQAEVPPPDSGQAEAVAAIRTSLVEAEVRRRAGDYDGALAMLREAEAQLDGLAYEPIRTEVWLELGILEEARGEYENAEAWLRRVQRHGSHWRQWEAVRDATVALLNVLGTGQQRHAEALALRDIAQGLSMAGPREEATMRNNVALVLHIQGKYEDAEAEHRAALALQREALGPEHNHVATSLSNLAAVLYARGAYAEAEEEIRAALEIARAGLGEDHPEVATVRNNLAHILDAQGKYAAAEAEHRAVLESRRKVLGLDSPHLAQSHSGIGMALHKQGKDEEAETQFRTAAELTRRLLGEDHPSTATRRSNLATVLVKRGKIDEAEQELLAAVAIATEALGADHPETAVARATLASVYVEQGRHDEAQAEYRAVLAVFERALGPDHPHVATAHNHLGSALLSQGRYEEARKEYATATELREKLLGADHPLVAESLLGTGRALLELARPEEALPLLERAWTIDTPAPAPPKRRAGNAFALARALWSDPSKREQARSLAQQAVEIYVEAGEAHTESRREVEAWLRTSR